MDPALWELLRAEAGTDGDRVLEAVIRLAQPGIEIPDVRIVSRFGTIATCRIRARDVIGVRARPDVISLKAPRILSPGLGAPVMPPDPVGWAGPDPRPTDVRRSPELRLTGAGVVIAAVDWGVDVDSAAFRWPADPATAKPGRTPGGTRLLSFWDQRDHATGPRPDPYGYGSVHSREEIDRALQDPRPYERLGYHPAIADPRGRGSHGTRTMDIAAGNGEANGPAGIAPDADLIFVHLADRNTGGLANFGDSVRLLEAVDFICRTAGPQPCAINISAGRLCGPRDGTTLVERAFDELLAATPGRFIVDSAGNYFRWRAHSCGTIAAGDSVSLTVVVDPADITLNEVEIWYDGGDEFAVRVDPPGYAGGRPVRLGERSDILVAGRAVGRVYHRQCDPNNHDNHIVVYLDPIGCAGNWTVTLEAQQVTNGRFHAWIERDDTCRGCQARFAPADSNPATTIGSIASSHLPLVVGAYDGHDPDRPVAAFSSAGPCRDGRGKPDLVAPGVDVLAARSAPAGATRNAGLLVRGNGTSFATPYVTGAAALCYEAAGGRLTALQIRSLVLSSCDPVPDADPQYRLGRGYLNIPRLLADVQQALATPGTAPGAEEPTMATEDVSVLAAAPAIAYREYLYRPEGQLARWISDRFDLVGRPGQPPDRAPRPGDLLLEVAIGRIGPGRCFTLEAGDRQVLAAPRSLGLGQLLLRPVKRAEMSEPLPVEPALGTPDLTFPPPETDEPLSAPGPGPTRRPLTTAQLREAWAEYLCAEREMVTILLLSNRTPVNPIAVEAFGALAEALRQTGYQALSTWAYNCRDIAQAPSGQPPRASLHAYGLAVDIDPDWNPHRHNVSGPIIFSSQPAQAERQQEVAAGVAGTVFTPQQVAAVEAIRTVDGLQVFGWGGRWRSSHDAMHFEVRLTPPELRRGIAAQPVPDSEADAADARAACGDCPAAEAEAAAETEEEAAIEAAVEAAAEAAGEAVAVAVTEAEAETALVAEVDRESPAYAVWVQQSLNRVANVGLAVDGKIGPLSRAAIKRFQAAHGLTADGIVGSKTQAALVAAGASSPPGSMPDGPATGPAQTPGVTVAAAIPITVPPTCVEVPALPGPDQPCADVDATRFAGIAEVATFAGNLSDCYADRMAVRRQRERHAKAQDEAVRAATALQVPNETRPARAQRIAAARAAVQPEPVETVRTLIRAAYLEFVEGEFRDTITAANNRWGRKCYLRSVARMWMFGVRERLDFITLGTSGRSLGSFAPPAKPTGGDQLVDIEPPATTDDGAKVQPIMNTFLRELRNQAARHSAYNYLRHGGGSFRGRGYSIDLELSSPKDERGFYQRPAAARFLLAIDAAARAAGVQWRAIYNDYAVAAAVNRYLDRQHVIFVGEILRGPKLTLNWHGPLILHVHVDIVPQPQNPDQEEESPGLAPEEAGKLRLDGWSGKDLMAAGLTAEDRAAKEPPRVELVPGDVVALRPPRATDVPALPVESPGDVDESLAIPVPATPWLVLPTLLPPEARMSAVQWNAQRHPARSQVDPGTIRARLGRYIDLGAIGQALTAAGVDPTAGASTVDNALCEAIHQFQLNTVVRGADGFAGRQTLDDLGLVSHRLHESHGPQGNVDSILKHHSAAVQQVTGGATAAAWWQGIVNGTFLGHPVQGGIHQVLMRRLRRAEAVVLGSPRFSGKTPVQVGLACGIRQSDDPSGWRPSTTDTNMHTLGLAIDVAPWGNPYVGGNAQASISNEAFSHAMQHAALLVSGEHLPNSFSMFLGGLGAAPDLDTAGIHRILTARDADLRTYLRLVNDEAALRARLVDTSGQPRTGVVGTGESLEAAAARWRALIAADASHLALNGSNFSPRDARDGFLNLPVELVTALRDRACLAWGAVDFGPWSGDMMHFDLRVDGIGGTLAQSTPACIPSARNSNHPCARAAVRTEAKRFEGEVVDGGLEDLGFSRSIQEGSELELEWEEFGLRGEQAGEYAPALDEAPPSRGAAAGDRTPRLRTALDSRVRVSGTPEQYTIVLDLDTPAGGQSLAVADYRLIASTPLRRLPVLIEDIVTADRAVVRIWRDPAAAVITPRFRTTEAAGRHVDVQILDTVADELQAAAAPPVRAVRDGVIVDGRENVTEHSSGSEIDKIVGSIAPAEGGFASVEGADRGVFTWGQGQWTVTGGELQKVMEFIKFNRQDLFDRYWGFAGLDISAGAQPVFSYGGRRYETGPEPMATLFRSDPARLRTFAEIFAQAGMDPQIQRLQREYMRREVTQLLSTPVEGHVPGEVLNTRGKAFYYSMNVNGPQFALQAFRAAIRETSLPAGAQVTDAVRARISAALEAYFSNSGVVAWDKNRHHILGFWGERGRRQALDLADQHIQAPIPGDVWSTTDWTTYRERMTRRESRYQKTASEITRALAHGRTEPDVPQ